MALKPVPFFHAIQLAAPDLRRGSVPTQATRVNHTRRPDGLDDPETKTNRTQPESSIPDRKAPYEHS
jgi:hypothetical protein